MSLSFSFCLFVSSFVSFHLCQELREELNSLEAEGRNLAEKIKAARKNNEWHRGVRQAAKREENEAMSKLEALTKTKGEYKFRPDVK